MHFASVAFEEPATLVFHGLCCADCAVASSVVAVNLNVV